MHVSQAPPTLSTLFGEPAVRLRAADLGVPQLGAVLSYGALVAPLQRAWEAEVAAQPERLRSRFGTPVAAIKPLPAGVEVDAGIAEPFDLAVVAEGGVFAEQARKALVGDYGQTAWVGQRHAARAPRRGMAFERFTRHGPAALLPLPADGGRRPRHARPRWCGACPPTTTRCARSTTRSAWRCSTRSSRPRPAASSASRR